MLDKGVKMTKPLSVWNYYRENRRKVNVVFTITFLSVFLQCGLSIYTTSTLNLSYGTYIDIFSFMNIVTVTPEFRNDIIQQLNQQPAVAKILPCGITSFSFSYPVGECLTFWLEKPETKPLMQTLKLKLIQGRLPAQDSREVVLHWRIAANKGLKIGDRIGKKQFPRDFLAGEYRLTGLLDGRSIIGFGALNTFCHDYHIPREQLQLALIAQPGREKQLKQYLEQLKRRNHGLVSSTAEKAVLNYLTQINLMINIIHMVIISILTICTGFLFYLYFYQRRAEFGLLEALGHTRQMIIGRSFGEILIINQLGFGCALSLAFSGGWALNHFFLENRGLALLLWNPGYLCQQFSTPLFATCCALMPVWRMLKKIDPIAIIEGQTPSQSGNMFKPLSVRKYLLGCQRPASVVFIVTCLSVVLQSLFLNYATSLMTSIHRSEIEPWTRLTYTGCRGKSLQTRAKQALLHQSLRRHSAVAQVLPFTAMAMSGNQVTAPTVFFIDAPEIPSLMDHLQLHLIHGRMPRPDSHEIILHWELAANKQLKIGEQMGDEISKLDALPGKFRVVGLFDGKAILGFADLDLFIRDYRFSKDDLDLLLIPKTGQLGRVKHHLTQLRQKDKDIYDSTSTERAVLETADLFSMVLHTVYSALSVIVALCVSFLFFLYFYKRRPEFGMLEALGHSRKMIIGRAFLEMGVICFSSFLLGLALAFLGCWGLNQAFLIRYGIPLTLWASDYPAKLLPLPVAITLFSVIPVWRLLSKVDPLTLIEGKA